MVDEQVQRIYPKWVFNSLRSSVAFMVFSSNALLVMSFDRYLATSYPIFHRFHST